MVLCANRTPVTSAIEGSIPFFEKQSVARSRSWLLNSFNPLTLAFHEVAWHNWLPRGGLVYDQW